MNLKKLIIKRISMPNPCHKRSFLFLFFVYLGDGNCRRPKPEEALRQFTQWLWIEHLTSQLRADTLPLSYFHPQSMSCNHATSVPDFEKKSENLLLRNRGFAKNCANSLSSPAETSMDSTIKPKKSKNCNPH